MRTMIAALSVVYCLVATLPAVAAEHPKESIAGIWHLDQGDGTHVRTIILGDTPEVPPEVLADLEAFNASLAQVPEELRYIDMSLDGRGFGIAHDLTSPEPTGVWVWPNWRDASPVVFEDFSHFGFHSNLYVYLEHREPGKRAISRVAKITEPNVIYTLPGVFRRHLRMLDDGRWVSTAIDTEQLIMGQLDPEHPEAGADEATAIPLEYEGTISDLAWVRDGDYLVVEIKNGDDYQFKVINTATLAPVDTTNGKMFWGPRGGHGPDQSRFYGSREEEWVLFEVVPSGQIQWGPSILTDHDTPGAISPSGQFVLTYWRPDFETQDNRILATVLAPPAVPLPTWPEHEVAGEDAGRYFWLSWE